MRWIICFLVLIDFISGKCIYPGHGPYTAIYPHEEYFETNAQIRYACDFGYTPLGDHIRYCQSNGSWTGSELICAINVALNKNVYGFSDNVNTETKSKVYELLDGVYRSCTKADLKYKKEAYWNIDLMDTYEINVMQLVFDGTIKVEPSIELRYSESNKEVTERIDNYAYLKEMHPETVSNDTKTVMNVRFNKTFKGRYIRIVKLKDYYNNISLCEVSVFSRTAISDRLCPWANSLEIKNTTMLLVHKNKCYSFHNELDNKVNWETAKSECYSKMLYRLATDIDKDCQEFLQNALQSGYGELNQAKYFDTYWIGGFKKLRRDDRQLGFTKFDYEPNKWYWGNGNEIRNFFWDNKLDVRKTIPQNDECLSISAEVGWKWTKDSCAEKNYFICQSETLNCGTPDVNFGSMVEVNTKSLPVKAEYKCVGDYKIPGRTNRICNNGVWMGKAPICLPDGNFCELPRNKTNDGYKLTLSVSITLEGPIVPVGSKIEYNCESVPIYRVCQSDGQWSGKEPLCQPGQSNYTGEEYVPSWVIYVGVVLLIIVLIAAAVLIFVCIKKQKKKAHFDVKQSELENKTNSRDRLDVKSQTVEEDNYGATTDQKK